MCRFIFAMILAAVLFSTASAQELLRARFAPATSTPKAAATCSPTTCVPAVAAPATCTPATTGPKASRPTLARAATAPVMAVVAVAARPLARIAHRRSVAQRRAIQPVRRVWGALSGRRMRYAG